MSRRPSGRTGQLPERLDHATAGPPVASVRPVEVVVRAPGSAGRLSGAAVGQLAMASSRIRRRVPACRAPWCNFGGLRKSASRCLGEALASWPRPDQLQLVVGITSESGQEEALPLQIHQLRHQVVK